MDKYKVKSYKHYDNVYDDESTTIVTRRTSPNNEWIKTNKGKTQVFEEATEGHFGKDLGWSGFPGDILILDYSEGYGKNKKEFFLHVSNDDWKKI